MAHIDYFFATVSPFTYLAGTRLEEMAAKHGATITYKPLDVISLFGRTGGVPPKDRHPARQAYRLQELRRQAAKAGKPINLQPAFWPTNPAPSSYVIIAAQKAGGGDLGKLVATITAKCWAEEKNIAEDDVIREALTEAGFDESLANGMMMAEADEYAANLEEAVTRNVFGAPFYVVDEAEYFWGQDRLDDLDLFLSGKL
jgi:2-hydroxychromene-2-carboxylate isomerase